MSKIFVIALIVALIAIPVAAQEATPTATEVVSPSIPIPEQSLPVNSLLLMLVGSLLVGGIAVGAPAIYIIRNLTKTQKDLIEKLYQSAPTEWKSTIAKAKDIGRQIADFADAVLDVADEVTDGEVNK